MGLREDVLRDCERFGESETRLKFAAKSWSDPVASGIVEDWLSQKDAERAAAASARRDAREERAISIAESANRRAWWANIIAIIAAIMAAAATILAARIH